MKNNFFGILFLLLFIAPLTTTYFFLEFQKQQVKEEVKKKILAGIDKIELVLLKFTEKETKTLLNWEHSKEFEYKGEMYDVVETKTFGDTTYYWLWCDNEESELNKQLDQFVSLLIGNNPKNRENQKQLQVFLKSLFYSECENTIFIHFDESKNNYHLKPIFYQSLSITPPLPPPKKV